MTTDQDNKDQGQETDPLADAPVVSMNAVTPPETSGLSGLPRLEDLDPIQQGQVEDSTGLDDPRPVMTKKEESFHKAVAGSQAAKEAAARGSDPDTADAIGETAAGGRRFGSLTFRRPGAFAALAVPKAQAAIEKAGIPLMGLQSTGVFLFCFSDPRLAFDLANHGRAETLVTNGESVVMELDDPDLIEEAEQWCLEAFCRLNGVKKPSSPEPSQPESAGLGAGAKPSLNSGSPGTVAAEVPAG